MIPTQSNARKNMPKYLEQYIVKQNYDKYTAREQATWRFIMRQLQNQLEENAHKSYQQGLTKAGIYTHKIPRIEEMDSLLDQVGWEPSAFKVLSHPLLF